jgi:hypothetical protein
VVSVIVAAADITFKAASGANLKALVRPEDLLVASGRFESTTWTATALGPPLGGAAFGLFGPVTTVLADAVSYLLSAAGIRAIGGPEAPPGADRYHPAPRPRPARRLALHPDPPVAAPAVLQLDRGQRPDPGDRAGARRPHARPSALRALAVRAGLHHPLRGRPDRLAAGPPARRAVRAAQGMLTAGTLRACWPVGLTFIGPGIAGLVLVMAVELGLITCIGVFNPVYAAYRLEQTPPDRVARTLSAWSVTSNAVVAALTALWGVLASLTSLRAALALAGLLLLATPLLLPRHDPAPPGKR